MEKLALFGPAGLAATALLLTAAATATGIALSPLPLIVAAGLIMVASWVAYVWAILRPVRQLAVRLAGTGIPETFGHSPASGGPFGLVAAGIEALCSTYNEAVSKLLQERDARREAELALQQSEAKYALAIRCANEGVWELDLKSGVLDLSPNIMAIMGYGANDHGSGETGIARWADLAHPDDLDALQSHFDDHVAGRVPLIDISYRARCKDGHYRWLLSRGRALRTASGRPYRIVGVSSDITARKRAEDVLHGIAAGMTTATGDDFFRRIVRNFAEVLGVDFAFITRCKDNPPTEVEMLAAWREGSFISPWDFKLAGTPCQSTINERRTTVICERLGERFPVDKDYESYLGIPIFDHRGELLGHLACFARQSTVEEPHLEPIFNVFATRAGLEIENQRLFAQLKVREAANALNLTFGRA